MKKKMEFGWIVGIGILATFAFVGKCGKLYYNSLRHLEQPEQDDNVNLLNYRSV